MTISDRLARFNRRITNPIVRIFAGRRLSPVAIVEHHGRTTGRHYRTPVAAFRIDDGYLISLPYGAERDWVKNVLAADSCTLERAGQRIALTEPTLLGQREGAAQLPWLVRTGLLLLRVKAVLELSARQQPAAPVQAWRARHPAPRLQDLFRCHCETTESWTGRRYVGECPFD